MSHPLKLRTHSTDGGRAMRIGLVFGAGVAGLCVSANLTPAQFAGGRQPGTGVPQLPAGLQPAAPVAYQPPAGPVARASYPSAAPAEAPHPWLVKPENGAWMILVRGYVGADARKLAEQLCKEIRETHKVAAYLYERNGPERRKELELQEAIRRKAEEDAQPFLQTIEQARKKAEQDGHTFVPSAPKLKVPKPLNPLPEQWAVLIGGFPDGDAARRGLAVVKKYPSPKDPALLQEAFIAETTPDKVTKVERHVYLNPYATALVVPNPTVPQATEDKGKLDAFMVQMNKDVPNSLLGATKQWTLLVKTFSTPMKLVGKDGGANVFDKAGGLFGKKNMLDLTAAQALQLCEALRHKDMKPAPLEAFVLHHRTGSLVTVGQFDAPDDPELLKLQQTLRGMTFKVFDEKTRTTTTERMFDSVSPFPVPRH